MVEVVPDWKPTKKVRDPKQLRSKPKAKAPNAATEIAAWHAAVMSRTTAMLWTDEDWDVIAKGGTIKSHGHHIITRGECRKHGAPEWDARNGVPVSERRHARHHSRIEPIDRSELPDEVYGFLADYPALVPYFERMYESGDAIRRRDGGES